MNVPSEILEKLKCNKCEYYLSCGPVYIKHEDGEAICGRCGKPEKEPVTQNIQYETVAEFLSFPCKYSEFGCEEQIKFSQNNQNPHEKNCDFRKRLCPIVERGKCEWLGTWKNLLQHCKDDHKELVLENPCSVSHDISESSLINYLLVAFNLLFILHTKVCSASGKIFHSIRLLGESENAEDFEYQLDIQRNKEHLAKFGQVAPEGCLSIQENTSLGLSINSLLEIFGGFDGIAFCVTLSKVEGSSEELNFSSSNSSNSNISISSSNSSCSSCIFCAFCEDPLSEDFDLDLNLCSKCKINIICCKNKEKGCEYYDTNEKCLKHETYYCKFSTKCTLDRYTDFCNKTITEGTLFHHLFFEHNTKDYSIGTFIGCRRDENKRLLLNSKIGNIIVEYYDEVFTKFKIYSPLTSKELKHYKCTAEFIVIGDKPSECEELSISYETKEDWSFKKFIANDFYIQISINKILE